MRILSPSSPPHGWTASYLWCGRIVCKSWGSAHPCFAIVTSVACPWTALLQTTDYISTMQPGLRQHAQLVVGAAGNPTSALSVHLKAALAGLLITQR